MVIKYDDLARNWLIGPETFNSTKPRSKATSTMTLLCNIDKHLHGTYDGVEELPRYIAHDSKAMDVMLQKHTKKELTKDGAADALYLRYPCNFTMRDKTKTFIGMSADEQAWFESEMGARQKAEVKKGKQPERGESSKNTTTFAMRPAPTNSLCQTPACVKERGEKDQLKSALRGREEDLKAVKQDIQDIVERNTSEVQSLRKDLDEARRDANKCRAIQLDWTESGMRKMVRERDGRIEEMEKLCEELKVENKRLKSGSVPDKRVRVEDYFSEDEERPEKKMRSG